MLRGKSKQFNLDNCVTTSLADELLEQAQVKVCRVNRLTDFFPDVEVKVSPLSEEKGGADGKFYLPDLSFVKEGTFVL